MKKIIILFAIFLFPFASSAFTIVHISDIHASDKYIRKGDGGRILYPKMFKKCLKVVKGLGADLIISTGDYTNKGEKKYYRQIRHLMHGTEVIWVKGNHDSMSGYRMLSTQDDFFVDKNNWRIISLDTTRQNASSTGYISPEQIDFLKLAEQTAKNIIIAMHHPPFWYDSRTGEYSSNKEPIFADFFTALTPNVKYVLTGHWHHEFETEIDGVKYQTTQALTQDKKCNYDLINLDSY